MCLPGEPQSYGSSLPCPSKLSPRKTPPMWQAMLYGPLEYLLVATTICLGVAAVMAPAARINLPIPGALASMVQGVLVLLHAICEGPRSQLLPVYLPVVLLGANATGVFGGSAVLLPAIGAFTLLLAALSLALCALMPRLLPIGGRGPYAVAIATEHIRTAVDGDDAAIDASEKELWPLELMAQVFYPVEKSCVAKLPWFPSTLGRFRKSLAPAWGGARRVPFGLTQAGILGASVILGSARSLMPGAASSLRDLASLPLSSLVASPHAWAGVAASALCLVCLVSDLHLGFSRSVYKPRYLSQEQAKRIAPFSNMPGILTEYVCGFYGPGFEAGLFHAPDVPCFPVAPTPPGERKWPLVIFSHGLGGNRAIYAELAAAMASNGYVAVFMEHNDGSGSSCIFPDGRVTEYVRPPCTAKVTGPGNRDFRQAQLKRRGREIKLVRAHLANLVRGIPTDFEACRRVGLENLVDIKRPAFVGHSFGGATVLQGLSDEASSNGGNAESEYSMAFVMDAWTYPISDEARDQSIRIPVIFITTDTFLGAEGKDREDQIVENAVATVGDGANDLAIQLRVKTAEHTNFSDSTLYAPGVMRKMGIAGKIDGVTFIDQVTRLNLCALEVFLRRRTKSGDADKTPPPVDLSSVLVGSDLPVAFPEAHVRRGRAGGVLPSKDMPK